MISLTKIFVSGCLSDELYATSSELVNHVPITECNVLESGNAIDAELKDLNTNNSSGETCSCSTEDYTQLSDLGTREETENGNLNLSNNSKDETVQDLSESTSHANHKSSINSYEQQGARPKVVDRSKNRQGTNNVHLSNKKRKELAKQEKKKRREERRKDDLSPCVGAVAAGEQNTSNGIVADLGLLAI